MHCRFKSRLQLTQRETDYAEKQFKDMSASMFHQFVVRRLMMNRLYGWNIWWKTFVWIIFTLGALACLYFINIYGIQFVFQHNIAVPTKLAHAKKGIER